MLQVTSRLNYVHWVEDLLASRIQPSSSAGRVITGVDIGTGASSIYALLGARVAGWRFVATEVALVRAE